MQERFVWRECLIEVLRKLVPMLRMFSPDYQDVGSALFAQAGFQKAYNVGIVPRLIGCGSTID